MSMRPDDPGRDYDRDSEYGREGYGGPRPANPTDMPAIFLIVIGILSLLGSGLELFRGVQLHNQTLAEFEAQLEQLKKDLPQIFAQQTVAPEDMKNQTTTAMFGMGGVGIVVSAIIIMGGIRMRSLQSYGLAVTSAVLAMVPCITCAGCCGLGQGVGIWALVVLLKPEVKALFR